MRFHKACQIEKVVSKDTKRMMLQHVWLDVEKKRLLATDGRRALVIPADIEDGDTSGYIRSDSIKEWRKASRKSRVSLKANGKLIVDQLTFERPTENEVGKFPNVDMVLEAANKKTVVCTLGLNAKLLHELADGLGDEMVKLEIIGDNEPIKVSTRHGYGLLMPCRV